MSPTPLIPAWIGVPAGVVMMLVVASHLLLLPHGKHPPSRRRIRSANGALMLMTIPLLVAGFSLLSPRAHTKLFMLVWVAVMALLGAVIFFAMLDALNTIRLRRRARRQALAKLREAMVSSIEGAR